MHRERGREEMRERSCTANTIPKWTKQLRLDQAETRCLELLSDLSHVWQRPMYLNHLPSAFLSILAGNWIGSGTAGTKTKTHIGFPGLIHCTTMLAMLLYFKKILKFNDLAIYMTSLSFWS